MKTTPFFILLLLAGCAVGPNYQNKPPATPAQWSEPLEGGVTGKPLVAREWWKGFHDPALETLISQAVASNYDLRISAALVRQARESLGMARAGYGPTVDAAGSYSRDRASRNGFVSNPAVNPNYNLYQSGFDASWEIDVFGGVRRAVEAAGAGVEAAEFGREDALVSLLAEVAVNYASVRGAQLRLTIAKNNIQSQKDSVAITQAKLDAGMASSLDVAQASALEAATEAAIPPLETTLKTAIHHLSVLLGQPPGALLEQLSRESAIPPAPPEIPAGVPADILRRRPDIRQAERQLAAATANIGVATADLFPKFSLTGAPGLESVNPGTLFNGASSIWTLGPTVQWRVFDSGKIRSNIRLQRALQEQVLAAYEKAVLTAMQDVEDALVAYAKEKGHFIALQKSVDENKRAYDLAGELYSKGLTDFLNVVNAQSALYQAQDQLAQSRLTVTTDVIALYKALGGGWEEPSPAKPGAKVGGR
jgi:NodT family efflux transporter outer membrane factor (OMF) lipoprotein